MLRPVIRLATERPEWLAEHLLAYGELAGEELGQAAAEWRRRLVWQLAALVLGAIALTLAGVAALLWIAAHDGATSVAALSIVPAVPAIAALACAALGRPDARATRFERVRGQLQADAAAMQEVTR
ncbi:MAG: phage holin family protein [Piscinibacter sp.]|uniref:phage holin family protein n=1 Tax=Piscinibacter sp. TaxID=1903157 RepID=UPI003D0A8FBF